MNKHKSLNILKYRDVSLGMTKKEHKLYKKSNNTIILDKSIYSSLYDINYTDLKTLIIDEDILKDITVTINDCTANNIYVNNHKNLSNITIPYELIMNNNSRIKFNWKSDDIKNIEKINIIVNDKVIPISEHKIEKINIYEEENKLVIEIETYNKLIEYKIDELGNVKSEIKAYEIKEEDLIDGILDLRKYTIYDDLRFDLKSTKKILINKDILKNINKYNNLINKVCFDELEIIDDNEMKLIPTSEIVNLTKETDKFICKNDYYNNYLRFSGKEETIIYVDKFDNIRIINKEKFLKDENIEVIKIVYERQHYDRNTNFLILVKYKTGKYKYKVLIEDKEYILTDLFKNFILLNKDLYINPIEERDIKKNNWFDMFGRFNFGYSDFKEKYTDYLKYKERLEKLKKLGLSYNALLYMYDRKINSIINTETEEGLVDIDDINKFEVDLFNKMGEEYIKVKRLKK